MKKITLTCGDAQIDTTCEGLSQHIHNKYVVHGLNKKGITWYDALPENHGTVYVAVNSALVTGVKKVLDYITEDPLP